MFSTVVKKKRVVPAEAVQTMWKQYTRKRFQSDEFVRTKHEVCWEAGQCCFKFLSCSWGFTLHLQSLCSLLPSGVLKATVLDHHKAKQEHHNFTGISQTKTSQSKAGTPQLHRNMANKKTLQHGLSTALFCWTFGDPAIKNYIYIRQERFRVQLQFQLYLSLEYFLTLSALKPWRQEEVGSNSGWFLLQNHLWNQNYVHGYSTNGPGVGWVYHKYNASRSLLTMIWRKRMMVYSSKIWSF